VRVALVANRLAGPTPSGVDRYHRELVRELAGRPDMDCTTLATAERAEPTWVPDGVSVRHVPGPRKLVHLTWSLAGRPLIDRFTEGADLVHVTVPAFPVPSRAPIVYTIHDLMPLEHPEWFGRVHRWGARRAFADAAGRAAAIIADSDSTAAALTTRCGVAPERITVVPLGIGDGFHRPPDPERSARLAAAAGVEPKEFALFVGQVNVRKNLTVVLRALARLDGGFPLVVAGSEGPGAAAVRAEIDRLGLHDRVRFLGFVPDDDLPALMAAARVLVHPARSEGFGLTPLEAMAVGTPTIVTDGGALPGTVGDAALVAGPDDPDAWAAAIESLDPSTAATVAERGRAWASGFTWEATAAATIEVYRRVLEGRA
jgi:glycosyltransferase involved in cell wall biosynthesis